MNPANVLQREIVSPFLIADPGDAGAIFVDRNRGVCNLTSGADAETRTLPAPAKAGLRTRIALQTDGGGAITVTVTDGYNEDGDETFVLGDAGDFAEFVSIDVSGSMYWSVVAQRGTNIVMEDIAADNAAITTATLTNATVTNATVTTLTAPTVAAAEHGVGVIGTGVAPVTTRRTENGTIITETKIDLTGLASVATANDVIGLAAGGAAYIGRNVVANNGIIYKAELICLETPAGGDNDVNVVANASGTLAYDGAGGTTYGVDGGDGVAGQVVQDLVQGLTANHYFYLTAGAGDVADTYTAGQYIFRTYGHALLA